jgi:hypothetical protein
MVIIMLGSSYDLINIALEIDRSRYHHKSIARGGRVPLHHSGSVGDVAEVGEATRDSSGSFSPSNLHRYSLCFVVSCFSAAS